MSSFSEQGSGQYIVSSNPVMDTDRISGRVELFAEDGGPYSLLRKKTITIPNEWVLANFGIPEDLGPPVVIEVLPSHAGRAYLVIAAMVKLVFNSVPYASVDTSGVSLYLDHQVTPYADQSTFIFSAMFPSEAWAATATRAAVFQSTTDSSEIFETPIYVYGSANSLPTEGDSDLELTVYYVQDDKEAFE